MILAASLITKFFALIGAFVSFALLLVLAVYGGFRFVVWLVSKSEGGGNPFL